MSTAIILNIYLEVRKPKKKLNHVVYITNPRDRHMTNAKKFMAKRHDDIQSFLDETIQIIKEAPPPKNKGSFSNLIGHSKDLSAKIPIPECHYISELKEVDDIREKLADEIRKVTSGSGFLQITEDSMTFIFEYPRVKDGGLRKHRSYWGWEIIIGVDV